MTTHEEFVALSQTVNNRRLARRAVKRIAAYALVNTVIVVGINRLSHHLDREN